MGRLPGRLLHCLGRGLRGYGHANYCAENQQSVESACRGFFGDGAGCEEIFCGDRVRNGGEEAEFGIVELDSLVA